MAERWGAIRGHREGSIAGKEKKQSIASEIIKRERDAWKKVLGAEVEVKPLPEYVSPEVIKNLEKVGSMDWRYIPKLNLETLGELKRIGEEEFLKKLEKRYPNWRRYEGLSETKKKDHSISRNLEKWYWEQVKNEKVDFPQLKGQWIAVEIMPKPPYGEKYQPSPVTKILGFGDNRFNISCIDATLAIKRECEYLRENKYSHTETGLPKSSGIRLLEPIEWNLLANREGWGKTDTYEWTNTRYDVSSGYHDALIVGRSDRGGAAHVNFSYLDSSERRDVGFRVAFLIS